MAAFSRYKKAFDGEPVPYRRKLDKNKSAVLKTLKDLLESKSITLHIFIVYIQNFIKSYNFHALEYKEQRKQKTNISSDTSMSDLDLSGESSEYWIGMNIVFEY